MMRKKRGQLEIGFNWIYILIAGAVILMFFLGIVIRQKVVSEEKLSMTVLRKIDGIFTGAGLSEKTVNIVEVPEITLQFTCDNNSGYSDYSIKGVGVRSETPWQPIFAPEEIESKRLLTWTLEWWMPFKVINYLYISSPEIKYYIFSGEYALPEQFNWDVANTGRLHLVRFNQEDQIRLVFFNEDPVLPDGLRNVPNDRVTAVQFRSNGIIFYEKKGFGFEMIETVPWIGHFQTEDNPNLYGAIFSTDVASYKCNLMKVFRRLEMMNNIYAGKAAKIAESTEQVCGLAINTGHFEKMGIMAEKCKENIADTCIGVNTPAEAIEQDNYDLNNFGVCPVIY